MQLAVKSKYSTEQSFAPRVATVTPQEQALALISRIAAARGVSPSDVLGKSRKPVHDQVRVSAYAALKAELSWDYSRIARLFQRDRSTIRQTVEVYLARPKPAADPHAEIADLKRRLQLLTGADLARVLAHGLDMKLWQAQFLAIIIEAYPRAVPRERMCELYDEARQFNGIGGGGEAVSLSMCKVAICRVNQTFDDRRLPRPFVSQARVGVSLAPEAATWFAVNYGRPFIPAIAVPIAA